MRSRLRLAVVVPALASLTLVGGAAADHIEGTSCGTSATCADHQYWPKMTLDDVQKANPGGVNTLRGRKDRANELLGWHGSDTIYGGDRSDVLWADHVGTDQPRTQVDRIYGGGGTDFIFSARGKNTIYAGPGNDVVKIRYGTGFLDCGPGRDVINLPRTKQKNWKFIHCEKIDRLNETQRGGALKPLG